MSVRIKICGMTTASDAFVAVEAGAELVGSSSEKPMGVEAVSFGIRGMKGT